VLVSDHVGDWEELRRRAIAVPSHVVYREMAEETVILNIDTGRYHGIDPIGARFFEVMRETPQLGAAVDVLAAEFEQPTEVIQGDLSRFCRQLVEHGLVELKPAAEARR
jgi:hypothetical protein